MNTRHSAALALAEEVPVALVFNGITHAVMMASPNDLEDFALGFALTEGLLQTPSQLFGVDTEVRRALKCGLKWPRKPNKP